MKRKSLLLAAFAATLLSRAQGQTYDTNGEYLQTFAGSGSSGYADGVGASAIFNNPKFVVSDSHSNLFVWDSTNARIRKIAPDSMVTTFAGGGGLIVGNGTNVNLNVNVTGLALYTNDEILVSSQDGYIYFVQSNADISRLQPIGHPPCSGVCADSVGNFFFSSLSNRIYRATNGLPAVFAGSGNPGYADATGFSAAFNHPTALAVDAAENVYVWDSGNYLIRKIDSNANVTTFAGKYQVAVDSDGVGTNASFASVSQMAFDNSGNLILACNGSVRAISPTTNVTTLAGSFTQTGYTNGPGILARFNGASGVWVVGNVIYVGDAGNQRIRSITNNPDARPVHSASLQLQMATYPGLQITGTLGWTYQIQTSPDITNWTNSASVLLTSSPYLWIDQNPVAGSKFYRALLLP